MQNVQFERLDHGLFAVYQQEDEGVQAVILSEANILDLYALASREPSADEGKASAEAFGSLLEALDSVEHVPPTDGADRFQEAPQGRRRALAEKKPPRSRKAPRGFVRLSVMRGLDRGR